MELRLYAVFLSARTLKVSPDCFFRSLGRPGGASAFDPCGAEYGAGSGQLNAVFILFRKSAASAGYGRALVNTVFYLGGSISADLDLSGRQVWPKAGFTGGDDCRHCQLFLCVFSAIGSGHGLYVDLHRQRGNAWGGSVDFACGFAHSDANLAVLDDLGRGTQACCVKRQVQVFVPIRKTITIIGAQPPFWNPLKN